MADAALSAEKAARLHDQQVFLDRLSTQLADGQKGLTAAMAKMENPSLQSIFEANQRLAEASSALSNATKNGSPDLPGIQNLVESAVSNSDKAQLEIQAACIARDKARAAALATAEAKTAHEEKERQDAAQLQKLADERQQAEIAAQNAAAAAERQQAAAYVSNNQFRQPRVKAPQYRLAEDSIATVSIENSTRWRILVNFWSRSDHVWPAAGRAFVVEPGQMQSFSLRGSSGEAIYFDARAAGNPNLQWRGCDCGPDGQPEPIAVVGDSNLIARRLVEY
jgi:hypothetical protein